MNNTDTLTMFPSGLKSVDPIAIREFTRDDIPAVRDLAMRVWRAHYVPDVVTAEQIEYMLPRLYSDEVLLSNIEKKGQKLWVLFSGSSLMGYVALEPKGNDVWFMDKLYVDMALQRSGLGGLLLNHAISQVYPKELTLRVNRKNFKAINFYYRHGFVIEGMDCLDIGSGFVMDDFLMRKYV